MYHGKNAKEHQLNNQARESIIDFKPACTITRMCLVKNGGKQPRQEVVKKKDNNCLRLLMNSFIYYPALDGVEGGFAGWFGWVIC